MRNASSPILLEPTLFEENLAGSNLLAFPPALLTKHALLAGSLVAVKAHEGKKRNESVVLMVGVHFEDHNQPLCDSQYDFLPANTLIVSRLIPPPPLAPAVTLLCEMETNPDQVMAWLRQRDMIVNTQVLYATGGARFVVIDPYEINSGIRAVRISTWNDHCVYKENSSWKEEWDNYQTLQSRVEKLFKSFCNTRQSGAVLEKDCHEYQKTITENLEYLQLIKARADGLNNLLDKTETLTETIRNVAQNYQSIVDGKDKNDLIDVEGTPTKKQLDAKLLALLGDFKTQSESDGAPERYDIDIEGDLTKAREILEEAIATADPQLRVLERDYREERGALQNQDSLAKRIVTLEQLDNNLSQQIPTLQEWANDNEGLAATLNTLKNNLERRIVEVEKTVGTARENLEPFFTALDDFPFKELPQQLLSRFNEAMTCSETEKSINQFTAFLNRLNALATNLETAAGMLTVTASDSW